MIENPNNSLDISATIKLSPKLNQRPKSQQNNPAITAILQDLVAPGNDGNGPIVKQREKVASRIGKGNRNVFSNHQIALWSIF